MQRSILFLLIAAGCELEGPIGTSDVEEARDAVEASDDGFGCADVALGIRTDDDLHGLQAVFSGGLLAEARTTGGPVTTSFALPDPDVALDLVWGTQVQSLFCGDVAYPDAELVGTAAAIEGALTLELVPDLGYSGFFETGTATLTIEGALFEDPATGEQAALADTEIAEVYVGWLPG